MTAYMIRRYFATHTKSALVAIDGGGNIVMQCVTLELPWKDNAPQVSCIPEGEYVVRTRRTDKFGQHYHVQGVTGREWILFHPANFVSELRGCIIPGSRYADLNSDGVPDIVDSKATLNRMLAELGKEFKLVILSATQDGGTLPEVVVTATSTIVHG